MKVCHPVETWELQFKLVRFASAGWLLRLPCSKVVSPGTTTVKFEWQLWDTVRASSDTHHRWLWSWCCSSSGLCVSCCIWYMCHPSAEILPDHHGVISISHHHGLRFDPIVGCSVHIVHSSQRRPQSVTMSYCHPRVADMTTHCELQHEFFKWTPISIRELTSYSRAKLMTISSLSMSLYESKGCAHGRTWGHTTSY